MSDQPDPSRTETPAAEVPPTSQPPAPIPAATSGGTVIKRRPAPVESRTLPQYRVLLHNDDHTDELFVVRTIVELTPLSAPLARDVMITAHTGGVAEVLVTHRERAELYQEQFASKGLSVTIEPVV